MIKKISIGNWITIAIFLLTLIGHYFVNQMETTERFGDTEIANVQTMLEVEKLKIKIEHLETMDTKNERDKQNLRNNLDKRLNKFEEKMDKIYDILIKDGKWNYSKI